jgi:hypothetical protein
MAMLSSMVRWLVALWGLVTFGYVVAGTWALDQRGVSETATGLAVTLVLGGLIAVIVEFRP